MLARGKPPGSGQSLPNKQSHSDERLIAIVFLFSKGRTPIPRARLQCGTGWLCLVAVRPLSSCWPRLTAARSQEYLFSLLPPTHERAPGCRRPNTLCPVATLPPSLTAPSRGDEAPICAELSDPALNLLRCLPPWASCCPLRIRLSHLTRWPAVPGESRRLLPALSFPKPEPVAAELPVLVSHGASRLLRPRRAASGSAALGPAGRGAPAAEMSLRLGPCGQELAAAHRPPQNIVLRQPERRHCGPRAPPPSMPHAAP